MVTLFWAAAVVSFLEIALFFVRPDVLARLAFLPLGLKREVPISRTLRGELALPPTDEVEYRRAPRSVLSIARLRQAIGASSVELIDASLRIEPDGLTYLQLKGTRRPRSGLQFSRGGGRPWLIVSLATKVTDDVLVLRARALPVPCLGILTLVAAVVSQPPYEARSLLVVLGICALLFGVNLAMNRGLVRAAMDFVEDELRRES